MAGDVDGHGGRSDPRWRIAGWSFAAFLLLLPAIAMPFTDEVRWGPLDFLVFGTMLATAGAAIELAVRRTERRSHRVAAIATVALVFLAVWASLI